MANYSTPPHITPELLVNAFAVMQSYYGNEYKFQQIYTENGKNRNIFGIQQLVTGQHYTYSIGGTVYPETEIENQRFLVKFHQLWIEANKFNAFQDKIDTLLGKDTTDMLMVRTDKTTASPENKWHIRFLELAEHLSSWSKDPSTKIAALIVDEDHNVRAIGYNGFPRKVEDTVERLADRTKKYPMTVHAELNAIATSAKLGIRTEECQMVCTCHPCSNCAGAIINAGIKKIIIRPTTKDMDSRWKADFDMASVMFKEAGVEVIIVQ